MRKKNNWLITLLIALGATLLIAVIGWGIFNGWCEWKHDKDAFEYLQDKNKKADEVVVENEDGSVEATAIINL